MNKLQEAIAMLEADADRNASLDQLLEMLREKEQELGEDISEEDAQEALGEVLKAHMLDAMGPEPEDDAAVTVRRVFQEMDLKFREYRQKNGITVFELGVQAEGKRMLVKIYLIAQLQDCRISAIFPFQADPVFAYPLCAKIMQESYPYPYGSLTYDPRDGELAFRYTFSYTHGLQEDVFQKAFSMVTLSAFDCFDTIKQYATGRFRKNQRNDIICQAQKLIIELNQ